jgi:hypothetical protein
LEASLVKKWIATLIVAALPGAAQAVDVPGLGLDQPGLDDLRFGRYGLGETALVKGGPNGNATSELVGRLGAGHMPRSSPRQLGYGFPHTSNDNRNTAYSFLNATLIPVFAKGAVGHATSGGSSGPFVQAVIYEPDQVKRKGADGAKSRLQIKQKSYVAVRFGRFKGTAGADSVSGGFQVEACKAQVDVKNDPKKSPPGTAKMKFKCSGNSGDVQRIKQALDAIFGKPKNGFDLIWKGHP